MASDLANRYSAALHMISVEELPNFPASIDEIVEIKEEENDKFHDVLERGRAMAKAKGIRSKCGRGGVGPGLPSLV